MRVPLDLVFIGLTLSSSWGNGHATTFRSLIRGLNADHHRVLFLERDVPWYSSHRDLSDPDFCALAYYSDIDGMLVSFRKRLEGADAVIVGSYVSEGVALIDRLAQMHLKRLCFYDIDTPVTLARLDRGEEEYIARRQMSLFDTYFSFSGGKVLGRLQDEYDVREAVALYCSVDVERYGPTGELPTWDLGYLGTYSPDRQPTLERLLLEPARRLTDFRFVVAGAQYPEDVRWPANVERIDHLPPARHPGFYSRQRFTLNVTRADMIAAGWSPSVRLFEAAACSTPIISDQWPGLSELLPDGKALIIVRETEDVIKALTTIDERDRKQLAQNAKTIVLKEHTGLARARGLVGSIEQIARNAPRQACIPQVISA